MATPRPQSDDAFTWLSEHAGSTTYAILPTPSDVSTNTTFLYSTTTAYGTTCNASNTAMAHFLYAVHNPTIFEEVSTARLSVTPYRNSGSGGMDIGRGTP